MSGTPLERLLTVTVDVSGSAFYGGSAEVMEAHLLQILEQNGGPFRLVLHDHDIREDRLVRSAADTRLETGGGGTDFHRLFEHLLEQPPEGIIVFSDLMGAFPTETPELPVLWVPRQGYSTDLPFGAVIPEEMVPLLDLPATLRATAPAHRLPAARLARPPELPAFIPHPRRAPLPSSPGALAAPVDPALKPAWAESLYREALGGLLRPPQGARNPRQPLGMSDLATLDALALRGFLLPEDLRAEVEEMALRDEAATLLYTRLPTAQVHPETLCSLALLHGHSPRALAALALHPKAPEEVWREGLRSPLLPTQRGFQELLQALLYHPRARKSPEVQEYALQHGAPGTLLLLAPALPPELFPRLCRRLLDAPEGAARVGELLARATREQCAVLTREDLARLLSQPDAELRLRAMTLLPAALPTAPSRRKR